MIKQLEIREQFNFDKRLYFALICALYWAVIVFFQLFVIHDQLYYEAYSEQLAVDRIETILKFQKEWAWLSYVLLPLFLITRMSLVSLSILAGAILSEIKISFRKVFQVVLIAEIVYLIPAFIQLVYFMGIAQDYTLQDLQNFDYYSALALIGRKAVEPWLMYALACFNLFELLYWLVLALGFHWVLQRNYGEMLGLVATGYGTALLLWIAGITFLLVNAS
ncbi:MAG: hypothetical protein MUE85_19160 [Microscillaceae bacterium]|jgi:hypothetical protein|nr:hypothetical protein [Microscillaceae bacterium]